MAIFSGPEDYGVATLIVSIFDVNALAYRNGHGLTFRPGKVEFQILNVVLRKMNKTAIILALTISLAGCVQHAIIGTWQSETGKVRGFSNTVGTLTLDPDGKCDYSMADAATPSCKWQTARGSWRRTNDAVVVVWPSRAEYSTFTIRDRDEMEDEFGTIYWKK